MNKTYDAAIIGGGIIGMATAYYLSQQGLKTAVIEKKYLGAGSTGRCIGGIRQQFSTPTSIRLMMENIRLFSEMEETFGLDVEFAQSGYLFLAHTQEMVDVFKKNVATQQAEGVNVSLITPQEAKEVVPHLNTDGLLAATYCPDDAQAFPFAILLGYRKGILDNGGAFHLRNGVTGIEKQGNFKVTLEDGTVVEAPKVVLAAGPWSGELAGLIGLELPLFPERHEAIISERMPKFMEPMVVDYRPDGCYFQQMVSGQIISCYSPNPVVPGIIHEASFEFLPQVAWRMSRLVPALKNASFLRHWAGCYTMTPDGNPIVDQSEIEGLYIAAGMCGHGFMLGPGIGKHLASFMVEGEWDTDFAEFAIGREYQSTEKMK